MDKTKPSSSRLCSDEELQKARADMKELLARSPIPDEFKCPSVEENNKDKVGKKKKCVLPQERVDRFLNYQCKLHEHKDIDRLAQEYEGMYGDIKTLVTITDVFTKNLHDIIHAAQEEMRREVETKGYFTYEVTNDEAEDDNEGATASQQGPLVRGSRRHRP